MSKKVQSTKKIEHPDYPTFSEMIMAAWRWGEKDFESCTPTLKRIINMGLYSTCLICLGAVWSAYFYCCSCGISWKKLHEPQISMVLYQNGRAFISQTQEITIKPGLQTVSLSTVPKQLIVPSATISGPNLMMQSMNFVPATETHTYFERAQTQAVGQPVTLLWEVWKDGKKTELTKSAQLLATENREPVLLIDGKVQKGTDAKILYPTPTKDVKDQPDLTFTVLSNTKDPQLVNFSYMASGFEWKAFYNLYLDEDGHTMDIQGQVNLTNRSGVAYRNVNLDFVLGDINTLHYATPVQPENICEIQNNDGIHVASETPLINGKKYEQIADTTAPKSIRMGTPLYAADYAAENMVAKARYIGPTGNEIRDLKDYYVYHVPFPVQLDDGNPTMATFLNGQGLDYHKKYIFRNLVPLGQGNEQRNIPPMLNLTFNTEELGLPLPKGDFRVFNKQDDELFFVGEAHVDKITMPNQDVSVNMGEALDIYADTYLTGYEALSDEETLYTYQIDVRNVSDEDKDVTISQYLSEGRYILQEVDPDATIATPTEVKWEFTLPANATESIRFTILQRNLELIARKNEMRFKEDLCKDRAIIVRTKQLKAEEDFD